MTARELPGCTDTTEVFHLPVHPACELFPMAARELVSKLQPEQQP